jgi:hypothetical protein
VSNEANNIIKSKEHGNENGRRARLVRGKANNVETFS